MILGAGASIPCGLPSTKDLTDCAVAAFRETYAGHSSGFGSHPDGADAGRQLADRVLDALREAYAADWNFELLLHAVRSLDAFAATVGGSAGGAPSTYRPIASVFAKITPEYEPALQAHVLHGAFFAILRAIHAQVGQLSNLAVDSAARGARERTAAFIRGCAARFRLVVIDLNYDTVADDAGVPWYDGFKPLNTDATHALFDPARWNIEQAQNHLLLHLHGSARFGSSDAEWAQRSSPWEPALYRDSVTANASLKMTGSAATLIAGMDQGAYALISGMDKAGNMAYNPRPYGHYYLAGADYLRRTPRILTIGYGGRDPHLNAWIGEHADTYGDERRAAAILPYHWEWQGQHRRGENVLLRLLTGRQRWDQGQVTGSGEWRSGNVMAAGPLRLHSAGAPTAYDAADEIIAHLDSI